MKRRWLLLLFIPLVFFLSGCSEETSAEPPNPDRAAISIPAEDGKVIICEDAEGLVSVRIEDGKAKITYNMDQWEALHNIYAIHNVDSLDEGPFAIITQGKDVADACVGKVELLDPWGYEGFITPAVMLLMADGTVEYVPADPHEEQMDDILYSHGIIPWVSDIVSLSFEKTYEGIGAHTIYATDSVGVKYDVPIAARLRYLLWYDEWECELDMLTETYGSYYGYLSFVDESQVTYSIGGGFEVVESYTGTYRIILNDEDPRGYAKGLMVFDLNLDWPETEAVEGVSNEAFPRRKIKGSYFAEMTTYPEFKLWLSDGDCLYNNQFNALTEPKTEYSFFPAPHVWAEGESDAAQQGLHEMALQFVCDVPEVQAYLALGMSAISTGDTTLIDGMVCYDVVLGTHHGDHFVREIYYTFNYETWQVYEYDVVTDSWTDLEM